MRPDLSARPYSLIVEREIDAAPDAIYHAWTDGFDRWFAAPGTLAMMVEVGAPFFFETHFDNQRHPHYGRFLRLDPGRLVELTWVTGAPGTQGAETVVTLEIRETDQGARVTLVHAGFADEESKNGHEKAWPRVLAHLEKCLQANG